MIGDISLATARQGLPSLRRYAILVSLIDTFFVQHYLLNLKIKCNFNYKNTMVT